MRNQSRVNLLYFNSYKKVIRKGWYCENFNFNGEKYCILGFIFKIKYFLIYNYLNVMNWEKILKFYLLMVLILKSFIY